MSASSLFLLLRRMARMALAASAAALVAAGCATRPPAAEPFAGVSPPPGWAHGRAEEGASALNWWRHFDDPVLLELVERAADGHTSVGVARARLREARAARQEAAAALGPAVSVGLDGRRSGGTASGSSYQAGLDARWEADLFGANRHAVSAQEALARSAEDSLEATRASVAAEAALAYLDLRLAQARGAVARENLASQEQTLQISRWRLQAGLANSIEVEQALAAAEQTRAGVPLQDAAAARAAHALAVLTGQPPAALLPSLQRAADLPMPRATPLPGAPAEVLRRRPDVRAAEQQLRAAASRVAQADAARRPQLDIGASLAWTGATLGSLGGVSAARSLLAALAQPLFDGGRLDARLQARRAQFDAAREDYRAAVLLALREVEDALVGLDASRDRLAALERSLEAARNAALLATQRHAAGLIDFQTVLETQRTLLNVQDGVAGARAELAIGQVRLYKALGGAWPSDIPENLS